MLSSRSLVLALSLFICGFGFGCKSELVLVEDSSGSQFEQYLQSSPIDIEISHKYYFNVPYGENQRNVFDLWAPAQSRGKALVIYIHGGGFRGGDKSAAWDGPSKFGIGPAQINEFLSENIAFASINYSLLTKDEQEGVIKCLKDGQRALQFLRYHSQELGFDGTKIGLAGSSAGAGTALWLALNDDMAISEGQDEISKVSTRVDAVAVQETQSSYDIYRWSNDVFPEGKFPLEKLKQTALGERLLNFYGVRTFDEVESEKYSEYRQEVDMLSMVGADDPPIYILNKQPFVPEKGNRVGNLLHSPYHAVALREELRQSNVEHEVHIPAEGEKPKADQTIANFLLKRL
ncbi:MAG: alpha/beta hydrolase [Bacteroidota bacterium]